MIDDPRELNLFDTSKRRAEDRQGWKSLTPKTCPEAVHYWLIDKTTDNKYKFTYKKRFYLSDVVVSGRFIANVDGDQKYGRLWTVGDVA